MLTFEQIKAIENALGPEAAKPVVEAIQTTDSRVMGSLLAEVATKADVANLEIRMVDRFGAMDSRLARLENMVKVLIGLTALAIAFFSPVAEKLLGGLK
ncbi:MAG: hypothetical protein AAGU21_10785 [Solidesulfovibrio sp.]|uniref:hypothetical protein n=1 Tax=Solidesulfovibrio sp. TaxID=2910990 RepID=UPI002B21BFD7|nr:hypothetical protein [Solidesulfovibrio sp.]MEA4858514.1 hypothetical protein [Solidesulfovibrio sp.]